MCARCGLGEQRLTMVLFLMLNLVVFLIGGLSNLNKGFGGSWAYPLAKGAGYVMDLCFAVLVLPTLKSLQTAMRRAGTSKEWMPIDDPIAFHITVAVLIFLASIVHIACHCVHIWTIASAPTYYDDPLDLWSLSAEEQISGMTYLEQIFDLKNQLHRAETAGKYASPGEFLKMIKKQEGETFTHANAVLTLRNSNLLTELKEVRWHNELLLKHLPQQQN